MNNRAYTLASRADDKREQMRNFYEAAVHLIEQADRLRREALALDAEMRHEIAQQIIIETQLRDSR